jgi:hypothetical protein
VFRGLHLREGSAMKGATPGSLGLGQQRAVEQRLAQQ